MKKVITSILLSVLSCICLTAVSSFSAEAVTIKNITYTEPAGTFEKEKTHVEMTLTDARSVSGKYVVPDSVAYIGENAFRGNESVT